MHEAITVAGLADRGALLALLTAQMEEHDIAYERGRLEAAIVAVIEDASLGALLVTRNAAGAPVGVAYVSYVWSLEHGGRSAWLDELYVAPAHREGGVGTRLLRAAVEHARAHGCVAVDLEVEATHARAANLYRREGFVAHTRQRWVLRLG